MRAYIINRQIDDIRGTLFRQTMFAEFEKIIHALEESGAALDARCFQERISQVARGLFRSGRGARSANSISNACASRISTMRFTFTNMRPAFRPRSRSRNAFWQDMPGAVEAYLGFLKSGGSKFPLETLQDGGRRYAHTRAGGKHAAPFRSPPNGIGSSSVAAPGRSETGVARLPAFRTVKRLRNAPRSARGTCFLGPHETRMAIAHRLRLRRTWHGPRIHGRTQCHSQSAAESPGSSATATAPLDDSPILAPRSRPQPKTLSRRAGLRRGFSARRILFEPARPHGRSARDAS